MKNSNDLQVTLKHVGRLYATGETEIATKYLRYFIDNCTIITIDDLKSLIEETERKLKENEVEAHTAARVYYVTELEKQVLEALAGEMYAERGFSDAGITQIQNATGLSTSVLRGVAASLIQKGLIDIDKRENEWGINSNDPKMHIWRLNDDVHGLVKNWVENEDAVPVELIVK